MFDFLRQLSSDAAANGLWRELERDHAVLELIEHLQRVEVDVEAVGRTLGHASQGADLPYQGLALRDS